MKGGPGCKHRAPDVASSAEAAVGYESGGHRHEAEEVLELAFVAAMQSSAAGQPGHGSLDRRHQDTYDRGATHNARPA